MTSPQEPVTEPAVRQARLPLLPLILLMGVGPFATDTYIAALPELQRSLATSASVAQLTLTTFIVGLAVGQLVLGPISDARGRRGILVASTVAFTVLCVVCALSPNPAVLLGARLLQGIAAGAGVALGRAVVTDTRRGPDAAAAFGAISSFTFLAPVVAPVAGGLVLADGTWRTVFWWLTGLGALMALTVVLTLPETLPPERRQASGLAETRARMADLLRDRPFMGHVVVLCLAVAGFFTYIGGSSFVLQTALGISPGLYTIVFAVNAAAMAAGSIAFRHVVRRTGPARLRTLGLAVSTAAAVGLLVLALADPDARAPLAVAWVLLCLVVGGMGMTMPATTALAQEAGRRSAGTASALQGGLVFLTGALVTPLTGLIGYTSLLPMALAMAVFFGLAALALVRVRRRAPA